MWPMQYSTAPAALCSLERPPRGKYPVEALETMVDIAMAAEGPSTTGSGSATLRLTNHFHYRCHQPYQLPDRDGFGGFGHYYAHPVRLYRPDDLQVPAGLRGSGSDYGGKAGAPPAGHLLGRDALSDRQCGLDGPAVLHVCGLSQKGRRCRTRRHGGYHRRRPPSARAVPPT